MYTPHFRSEHITYIVENTSIREKRNGNRSCSILQMTNQNRAMYESTVNTDHAKIKFVFVKKCTGFVRVLFFHENL